MDLRGHHLWLNMLKQLMRGEFQTFNLHGNTFADREQVKVLKKVFKHLRKKLKK